MPTRAVTVTQVGNCKLVTWTGLLNSDDGEPFEALDYADISVQVSGTFGSGGTILLEGSIDGTNYFTLTDPQSSAISKTAAALEQVVESPRFYRPRVSAGDGSTALQCRLWVRRNR